MTETTSSSGAHLPRWAAVILFVVGGSFLLVLLPLAVSILSIRYGWVGIGPGIWNLSSLVLFVPGVALIVWSWGLHFVQAPKGWPLKQILTEMVPGYLLVRGPYRFTRNPMYLAVCVIWLGWTLFYGSIAVLIGLIALCALFAFIIVPFEERRLEARFGDAYKRYKKAVPRWLGPLWIPRIKRAKTIL